jgi:cellulose synthase (UDP-forming)
LSANVSQHDRSELRRNNLLVVGIMLLIVVVMLLSASNIDTNSQLWVGGTAILTLFVLGRFNQNETVRIIFLTIAAFISVDYFFWRTFFTLTYYDPLSFTCALLLYFAELYGFTVYALSLFVNIEPLNRPVAPLPKDRNLWPSVDVMIPTYNEDRELLEITLVSALQINYPADKFRVYLCDDGGTDQRCNSNDPDMSLQSKARRADLQELCRQTGAIYVTRERNEHAKAGNLNNALKHSNGDLVLILDADHVPTKDILEKTVGWFLRDPKLFLVQTPHFFTNPDPIEKNLDTFQRMPSENEMFYRVVQKGLDFWNAAFFCGSAAVLRRSCLREVGGFVGDTVTEDAETAITLHSRGYNSAYIEHPMISGLSPQTLGGFIGQRIRWAQGMVQIFLLKNPLLLPGLTLPQRLCYFSSSFFWFFGYARLVFIIAPFAFLFFGLKIYDTNLVDFLAFAVPHLIAVFLVSDFLFGKVRWSFVSELYELIQSVYTLPAIIQVFLNPRSPTFKVTAKGESVETDYISPLARPFYILVLISLAAFIMGIYKIIVIPDERFAAGITMFWTAFNLFILLCTLGALLERKERRQQARIGCDIPAKMRVGDRIIAAQVADLSLGGARLMIDRLEEAFIDRSAPAQIELPLRGGDHLTVDVHVRQMIGKPQGLSVGVQFKTTSLEDKKHIVAFVNGSSERWLNFQRRREERIGVFGSLVYLMGIGIRGTLSHLGHLILQSSVSTKSADVRRTSSSKTK